VLTGCSDFLERSAQDLIIPVTTREFKEILQGDAYFKNLLQNYLFVSYMTDDVEFFDGNRIPEEGSANREWSIKEDSRFVTFFDAYRWADEIENSLLSDNAYGYLYSQALTANVCIEAVETSEGTDEEKETLLGQASFTRAFAYLMLANLYAKPYGEAAPDDPCVPIKLTSGPTTATFARATMTEVWKLIMDDIDVALDNLKDKAITNIYEINHKAALVLAVRAALYMEDWDKAISHGEEYITTYGAAHPLYDISTQFRATASTTQARDATVINFYNNDNKELVWVFGPSGVAYTYTSYITGMGNSSIYWRVSSPMDKNAGNTLYTSIVQPEEEMKKTLIGQYNFTFTRATNQTVNGVTGDRRPAYWFIPPKPNYTLSPSGRYNYVVVKYDPTDGHLVGSMAFRTGEVYITLAEAYARRGNAGDQAKAISLLNDLRSKRIAPYSGTSEELTAATFATPQALVEFVWKERRRELCFEELHRWWDLRRTNQPAIVHKWRTSSYSLAQGDGAYVLNFPLTEREYNDLKLVPNLRPVRPEDNADE
jgi:hypothetical protein